MVGSAVFKTVSRALVPFWVGSIPMHLRHLPLSNVQVSIDRGPLGTRCLPRRAPIACR